VLILKLTPRSGSVSISAVFVPNKDDSGVYGERIKPRKCNSWASGDSFMMRFMKSPKVSITEHVQDLDAGIRKEDVIHNHIDETYSNITAKDESDMDHGKLLIVVRDSGVGMSKENQKR
jgi:signal transduction histidine kinase